MAEPSPPGPDTGGVRLVDDTGREQLVHEYSEQDYALEDIQSLFGLGDLAAADDGRVELTLSGSELQTLKALADAQSFDHPEDFIAMCHDLLEAAAGQGEGPFRFRGGD